jgi:TonB-linked SusC/RagA family outer membrane protein
MMIGCMSAMSAVNVFAQQRQVTGTVLDVNSEPVIGASIVEKGTSKGTISDINGKFALTVGNDATLQIAYIGYITQEIATGTQTVFDIVLEEDVKTLDEIVVVGYGTMKKKDLTGSVTQIKPEAVANEAPKTVQDILRGTPGLNVGVSMTAKGGGDLELRGDRSISSITSGSPLIILDDMPFYGELSEINPEIIGQIDILKDASAAATYGAKAANGVVVITTKKGKKGKPVINFSAKTGFATKSAYSEYYNADSYMKYREDWYKTPTYGVNPATGNYEAYQKGNLPQGYYDNPNRLPAGVSLDTWRGHSVNEAGESDLSIYSKRVLTQTDELLRQNFLAGRMFDWYDYAFQTGFNQDYNVGVSGASDKVNYYLSLGYLNNEGVVKGNEYGAVRANMKLSGEITPWLEVGANVNFQDRTDGDLQLNVGSTLANSPFGNYMDENGNLAVHPHGERYPLNPGYNYDYNRQYIDLESGYTVLNTILNAKVKLPFNISYSFNYSPRYQFYHYRYFESSDHQDWLPVNRGVDREQKKSLDWSLNNTVNWDYTLAKKNHIVLTLVQEAEQRESWLDYINARNIQPSDALGFHNTASAGKLESSFGSTDNYQSANGLLARLFYAYDDRYMLTTSVRRDGYSAFGQDNPYANFGSVALGWTFTNEKFFGWKTMDYGKLRLSWGTNGNRSLTDPYLSLANLAPGAALWGYVNKSGDLEEVEYLKIDRMASPNLQWEKSEAINLGLDFSFLNNRISGAIETYVINTKDMIMGRTLPNFTGFSSIATNIGEVQNKGFELALTTKNIARDNFEWNTTLTFTYNRNKVKHLYYDYEDVLDDDGNVTGTKESDVYGQWFIGRPIGTLWDYRVTGIWQPDEIDEAAKVGQFPGDPKVANLYTKDDIITTGANGEEIVTPVYNDKDKDFLGQTESPYNWSMRNTFILFKNFEFSFSMYSYLGSGFLDTRYLNQDGAPSVDVGQNMVVKDRWTPENPSNVYARLNSTGPKGALTPPKVVSGSFIRLDNVSLAYNVPSSLLKKWNIGNLKIYGNIRNAALWTKDEWNFGDIETRGLGTRVFTIGLNITL